jgi:DNA helicase-2/ATP-dependent DNA helicase PcrA
LEFDSVVLAGVEEGLLPHQRAIDEGDTDEERRLLYVGITRAKNSLLITSARQRKVFGDIHFPMPSQFIKDLDEDVLQQDKPIVSPSLMAGLEHDSGIGIGSRVSHPSFGEGIVLELEGSGDAARISVEFERAGLKRLMLKYAALQAM